MCYTHLCNVPPDFILLIKVRMGPNREGRACRDRRGHGRRRGTGADGGVRTRQARPSRVSTGSHSVAQERGPPVCLPSWPVHPCPPSMDEAARKPTSKSSPCPRASARSVLTGRRPRDHPASTKLAPPNPRYPTRAAPPRSQQVATLPLSVLVATLPPPTDRRLPSSTHLPGGTQCSVSLHCIESFRSDSFVKRCGTLSGTACRSSL